MKKILKLSLVALVAMTTMSTYAIDGDFLLNVKKGDNKQISFSVNRINKVNVSIYDQSGNLIFSENATGKGGILKTYSLKEFPDGIYFLEVETNLKKVRHEIVIAKETTTLARKAITEVYKSDLKFKNQNIVTTN